MSAAKYHDESSMKENVLAVLSALLGLAFVTDVWC